MLPLILSGYCLVPIALSGAALVILIQGCVKVRTRRGGPAWPPWLGSNTGRAATQGRPYGACLCTDFDTALGQRCKVPRQPWRLWWACLGAPRRPRGSIFAARICAAYLRGDL